MKKLFALFFTLLCLIFCQTALAVTITINSAPSSVSSDPFNIDVSVFGASAGTNYLRADLYKDGTSSYFGETYNGGSWYAGSTGTSYYPLTIVDSRTTASATLQVRIGSPTSAEYSGSGAYKLKIRRYTSSGNAAGSDSVTPLDVTINYLITGSPTPTPKIPTPTTSTARSTSIKTPTLTKVPSVAKSSVLTTPNTHSVATSQKQIVNNSDKIATDFAKVQNPSLKVVKSNEVSVLGTSKKEFPFTIPSIIGGLVLLITGIGVYAKNNWEKIKIWLENL